MATATPSAGQTMMALFVKEMIRRLEEEAKDMKPADFEVIRKLLADNSVTIASVQRGDFGEMAQKVAEEFPFDEEETPPSLQ